MRNISIAQRTIISVLIAVIFIGATTVFFAYSNYNYQLDQKRNELKLQIDIVISFIKANRLFSKLEGRRPFSQDEEVFKRIEKINFGNNSFFYIYEGTTVRYHGSLPHAKGKDFRNIVDTTGTYIIRKMTEDIALFGESSFIYSSSRKGTKEIFPTLTYNHGIPGTGYWVGTSAYIDDIYAAFWTRIYQSAFATFLLAAILLTVAYFVSKSVTTPIGLVKKRMVRLAEGDSSSPVPELNAKDEIGEIASALDIFRENKKYAHELSRINTEIERQALNDPLTGLANRRYFEAHFSHLKQICKQNKEGIILFHLDLDRFKDINDTLGHAAGDFVLQHIAETLPEMFRPEDFVARAGGDEFLIVGRCPKDTSWAGRMSKKLIKLFAEPLPYDGRHCRFGVSIGIISEDAETIDIDEFVKGAEMALNRAKAKGGNRSEVFSRALEVEVINRNYAIEEFLDGLDLGQLFPYYQPQFDIHTLDLVGVEVLARWSHPEKGILEPAAFLNIAEDQRVLAKINQAIAIQALQDCNRLIETNIHLPKVSVNFSLDSLQDPGLVKWLDNLMPFPTKLSLELIESIPFEDHDETVMDNLIQIKERGIDIEIDDFGSSHASILSLLEARPHRLKIDRKIITPIINSEIHRKLLQSVIEMGNSLDVPIIVGGVETMEHLEYIQKLNVDAFQGFAIAAPMKFNDLRIFLKTEAWRNVA